MKTQNFRAHLIAVSALVAALGGGSETAAQNTYTLPTGTGSWSWTPTTLGTTGWFDDSTEALGSIADLAGWDSAGSAIITPGQMRQAYQVKSWDGTTPAGGIRNLLGGDNSETSLLIGAGGFVNNATAGSSLDVKTRISLGATQTWGDAGAATFPLTMDFRPDNTNHTKLNLGTGYELIVGNRFNLVFNLGNTTATHHTFIEGKGIITAGGATAATIGIGNREAVTDKTFDLTGASLAIANTNANPNAIALGRGTQTGNIIKIDGLSGTSGLGTNRGAIVFNASATSVTGTTLELVGSGSYTIDARIRDFVTTPLTGSSLLIKQTGGGTQTFAGSGTHAITGGSWNSTAALQVDHGTFIISGEKDGNGAMTVGTAASAAKLVVNGSAAGAITVGENGVLAGHGSVQSITINGATTTGGALDISNNTNSNPGDLNATSLVWNGTTDSAFPQMTVDLSNISSLSDQLILSGVMTKGTGTYFQVDFGGTGDSDTVRTYTLVTAAGGFGSFLSSDFSYTGLSGSLTGSFAISGNNLDFTTVVIPEPGGAWLGGLGMLALLRRRRAW
jgi:hypothetical protein